MPSVLVSDLVTELQQLYTEFEAGMAAKGAQFKLTCTYRSQAEQDALYARGRTTQGPIVTWKRHSNHTDRRAFDIAMLINNKVSWDPKDYAVAGEVGRFIGLVWGGDWIHSKDYPHFELAGEKK
jgi:peptidoglycan LD-endopeptidase CwlK